MFDPINSYFDITPLSFGWVLLPAGLQGLMTIILLLLAVGADWAWLWRECPADNGTTSSASGQSGSRNRWRALSRSAVYGISLIGAWMLCSGFWVLLPPSVPPLEPGPIPNGYDEIVRAGTALNWTAIPNEEFEAATVETCQTFLQANASLLTLTRQAFSMRIQLPKDFRLASFSTDLAGIQAFRSLSRALGVEAKVAVAEGRFGDAARDYLDIIRLGQTFSRGGLIVHDLVSVAIESMGIQGIVEELNKFDAPTLAMLTGVLEKLADAREPLDQVLQREMLWERLASGWMGRLEFWVQDKLDGNKDIFEPLPRVRARILAHYHLLLAEAAIRRHVLVEGPTPESLASLVPKYLSAVPQDPFGDGPLIYRLTADGYLLYSVGANGTDDGGQRVSLNDATTVKKGDLFFDASPDMPEESDDSKPQDDVMP